MPTKSDKSSLESQLLAAARQRSWQDRTSWLETLRQAGGWAYKTGAVARAEREVQALATPQPTSICGGPASALMTSSR